MTPKKPYLVRALFDWITDSGLTPYVLVKVVSDQVRVPADYVQNGQIVLNVSGSAVRNLVMDNDALSCSGRFGGQTFDIHVPMSAVAAIYSKETSEGMMFDPEEAGPGDATGIETGQTRDDEPRSGGHLKVIK